MYFITLDTVPFHPDEATNLYMRDDLATILSKPLSVSYQPGQKIDLKTHYRLMDPPITRLYLGTVDLLTNIPNINDDWNWSRSWDENVADGNLPSPKTLYIFRSSLLLFFPFTCYFIYAIAKSLMSHWAAIITTLIFAFNPLILLHSRHVMTEAILLFFTSFLLMLFVDGKKHMIFVPLIFTLALNSKQTAFLLFPAYILYLFWCLAKSEKKAWFKYITSYIFIPLVITFLLNPVSWSAPFATIQAAAKERNTLIQGNEYFLQQGQPELLEQNIAEKLIVVIYHTVYEPLAMDDFPIYREAQQASFTAYLQNPFQKISRNIITETILLILVMAAITLQGLDLIRKRKNLPQTTPPWLFIYTGFFGSLAGLSTLSSVYQRYTVILIPFLALFIGWFIYSSFLKIKKQPE
jgi:4-amino-4-deoxy-L-arabinose transferase-like glycosyltransferase